MTLRDASAARVRMQAADLFEQEVKQPEVAQRLRVSRKSAYQWHQVWRDGGAKGLASRGPSGSQSRLCVAFVFVAPVFVVPAPVAQVCRVVVEELSQPAQDNDC
ncbi:helix-turn-helix domain-containing protein [Streptomyces sp. NPDC019890]|uniref:helix-turn-helix domain-containing protein n=1 Tax=Streptomyces sp. NPDC019890 TaxID=3365064 RepID=UPI00384B23D6